ncbi:DUF721 domain-containing protein [Neogemmobacter tilapiae]|uniref:DUF721 domain-containing protein n=1 Tax=Neogemmobacter tilapiae TaxID=875041 RepID=A0A918TVY7_9RHOB|nr:DciA family protein [Gemmobacter tilapiae]GHC64373.1 hypothetical protein GCM10007315_30940 [Gemmobacter tilapiae]
MTDSETRPIDPNRRKRGFEAASHLLKDRIAKAGESRGFAIMKLLTHWPEVAGGDLAPITRPVKISYARDGMGATLVLLAKPAHAPMIQMQLPRLKDRINAVYGYNAIARITLTQTAPTGFAEGQAEFTPAPKVAKTPLSPTAEARAVAAGVGDSALRSALEQLAANVLNRQKT